MIAMVSTVALAGSQAREGPDGRVPTRIRDVSKLKRVVSDYGTVSPSWPEFEFRGVRVWGDMWLQDYNDAIAIVRAHLTRDERIFCVDVTPEQIPGRRGKSDYDLQIQTCPVKRCSGGGRVFHFKRMDGTFLLIRTLDWQS